MCRVDLSSLLAPEPRLTDMAASKLSPSSGGVLCTPHRTVILFWVVPNFIFEPTLLHVWQVPYSQRDLDHFDPPWKDACQTGLHGGVPWAPRIQVNLCKDINRQTSDIYRPTLGDGDKAADFLSIPWKIKAQGHIGPDINFRHNESCLLASSLSFFFCSKHFTLFLFYFIF